MSHASSKRGNKAYLIELHKGYSKYLLNILPFDSWDWARVDGVVG